MRNRQVGLTLVELLVALVIGLILVGGVVQIFVSNKQTYQLTDELARMQESARYAFYVLSRDLRMAGYTGCTSRNRAAMKTNVTVNVIGGGLQNVFNPLSGVEGWDSNFPADAVAYAPSSDEDVVNAVGAAEWTTGGTVASEIDKSGQTVDVLPGADVIRVWHVLGSPVIATTIAGSSINTGSGGRFRDGDVLLVTDCATVDIVQACDVTPDDASSNTTISLASGGCAPGNTSTSLLNMAGSHVDKLAGYMYYVGKRPAITGISRAQQPPALYRRLISRNGGVEAAEELVEGVESLQFLYGEDTSGVFDGIPNRYVDAANVGDWNNVVSVRVEMLIQSDRDDLAPDGQSFTFDGTTVSATDGRLRYPYVATVSLRNRTP